MLLIGLLMPILLGALLIRYIHPKATITETIGLAFLVGLFLETVFMIALDTCSIPFTRLPMLLLNSGFSGLLFVLMRKRGHRFTGFKNVFSQGLSMLTSRNVVWLLLLVVIAWFEYLNLEKSLYFPTFDHDSLVSFDTIGYVLSQEHTYKGLSIFNPAYFPDIKQAGSTIGYAPLVQLSYGYVYLFGAETSKLIPALVYLSFIIGFYAVMTRCVKRTGAALITLLMMLTPEMIAFSSLSATNVIHAAYASLGTIYGLLWLKTKQKGDLIISALLLAGNVWARYEGILFIVILGMTFLLFENKKIERKVFLGWALIATIPFIFWMLFQQVTGLQNEKGFIMYRLFWDAGKMGTISQSLLNHLLKSANYGWTFFAVPLSLIVNLWPVITKRDNFAALFALSGGLILYGVILYQVDYSWDSIENVLAFSAKRFLFCFVPIAWFYVSTNQTIKSALIWVDDKLAFVKSNQSAPV